MIGMGTDTDRKKNQPVGTLTLYNQPVGTLTLAYGPNLRLDPWSAITVSHCAMPVGTFTYTIKHTVGTLTYQSVGTLTY